MFWRNIPASYSDSGQNAIARTLSAQTICMKAKVYVTLKAAVLDPQGKAIKHSVELLGFNGINDIRQGKYFEIAIDGNVGAEQARTDALRLAHDVLSNPIIEDFRVEIEE
jgi:phosphoribosylformylglycinamidine synthase